MCSRLLTPFTTRLILKPGNNMPFPDKDEVLFPSAEEPELQDSTNVLEHRDPLSFIKGSFDPETEQDTGRLEGGCCSLCCGYSCQIDLGDITYRNQGTIVVKPEYHPDGLETYDYDITETYDFVSWEELDGDMGNLSGNQYTGVQLSADSCHCERFVVFSKITEPQETVTVFESDGGSTFGEREITIQRGPAFLAHSGGDSTKLYAFLAEWDKDVTYEWDYRQISPNDPDDPDAGDPDFGDEIFGGSVYTDFGAFTGGPDFHVAALRDVDQAGDPAPIPAPCSFLGMVAIGASEQSLESGGESITWSRGSTFVQEFCAPLIPSQEKRLELGLPKFPITDAERGGDLAPGDVLSDYAPK